MDHRPPAFNIADAIGGLTAEQIDAIPFASPPAAQITIYSSIGGVITKRNVSEGQYVKEGDILYNPSHVRKEPANSSASTEEIEPTLLMIRS